MKNNEISFRFYSKSTFLLYHEKLVADHTAKIALRNACAVQVSFVEELIHAEETVEDRWSVQEMTSGILWVSSAGEFVVRVEIDSECMLTCWHF